MASNRNPSYEFSSDICANCGMTGGRHYTEGNISWCCDESTRQDHPNDDRFFTIFSYGNEQGKHIFEVGDVVAHKNSHRDSRGVIVDRSRASGKWYYSVNWTPESTNSYIVKHTGYYLVVIVDRKKSNNPNVEFKYKKTTE